MSYLVLARKYRPTTFADLVGQQQVSRTLQNALATGRIAHAYLFSGPRGVGKTTAARLLAMSLSCLAEKVEERPCGRCSSCLEIQAGQAVDVIEVDGASNRGINEIRDLRETVKYLPAKGRYKVYIIDEVHALTKDAFNALLKTLEEPPAHVVFIFATTETHKVLPTILSRCQRYDFRRIRTEDIAARLAEVARLEGLKAEPEALEIIASQGEGGLRDALSLMDQAIAAGGGEITAQSVQQSLGLIDQSLVRRLVEEILAGQAAEALRSLDEAYGRGYDFKDLGSKILQWVRALTLMRVDRKNAALMNLTENEERALAETCARHSLPTLNRHFDSWLKFQRQLQYNPQPRWLMEAQVIALAEQAPLLPMAELLERLGRLLAENPPPRPAASPAAPAPPFSPAPASPAPFAPEAAPPLVEDAPPADQSSPSPPPSNWNNFWQSQRDSLDSVTNTLLRGARPLAFGPQRVELLLAPEAELSATTEKMLQASLGSALAKALGGKPELILRRDESRDLEQARLKEKLQTIQNSPQARALMEAIPGRFVEYQPSINPVSEPLENLEPEEEFSSGSEEQYFSDPEDDPEL